MPTTRKQHSERRFWRQVPGSAGASAMSIIASLNKQKPSCRKASAPTGRNRAQAPIEAEEVTNQKPRFHVDGQIELLERLEQSVQAVDREIFESRQELKELEDARKTFASHLQTLQGYRSSQSGKRPRCLRKSKMLSMSLETCENDFDEICLTRLARESRRGFLEQAQKSTTTSGKLSRHHSEARLRL